VLISLSAYKALTSSVIGTLLFGIYLIQNCRNSRKQSVWLFQLVHLSNLDLHQSWVGAGVPLRIETRRQGLHGVEIERVRRRLQKKSTRGHISELILRQPKRIKVFFVSS
jgi:hypothetical protein